MRHLNQNMPERHRLFSLSEAVFLLMLFAVLFAYAPAVYKASREQAFDARCVSNLRELSAALFAYAQDNDERYPITEGSEGGVGPHTNWVLLLSDNGFADPLRGYGTSEGFTQWFCPAAIDRRTLSAGSGNTYGINWQASGGWFSTEGSAPGPGTAERPDLMGQVMDGHWMGHSYTTSVNSPAGIQTPDFVHAPGAGSDSRINVAYVDGRIGSVKQSDLPTDPADTFWTGLE